MTSSTRTVTLRKTIIPDPGEISRFASTSNKDKDPAMRSTNMSEVQDSYRVFRDESERLRRVHAGFLGPTSYSAILFEHQSHLDVDLGDWSKDHGSKEGMFGPNTFDPTRDPSNTRLCVRALSQIPCQSSHGEPLNRFFRVTDYVALHQHTVHFAHESFWSRYGAVLASREISGLSSISEELCHNGRSVLGTNVPDDIEHWPSSFTGTNFRWETVSLKFSYV